MYSTKFLSLKNGFDEFIRLLNVITDVLRPRSHRKRRHTWWTKFHTRSDSGMSLPLPPLPTRTHEQPRTWAPPLQDRAWPQTDTISSAKSSQSMLESSEISVSISDGTSLSLSEEPFYWKRKHRSKKSKNQHTETHDQYKWSRGSKLSIIYSTLHSDWPMQCQSTNEKNCYLSA